MVMSEYRESSIVVVCVGNKWKVEGGRDAGLREWKVEEAFEWRVGKVGE